MTPLTRRSRGYGFRGTGLPSVAAIDLGTHSVRALLASFRDDGRYQLLDDLRIPTGLGIGLMVSGRISSVAHRHLQDALELLFRLIQSANVRTVSLVATSALRTAADGPQIIEEIRTRFSVPAAIITGTEEARLLLKSARYGLGLSDGPFTLIDIGAGSVEILVSSSGVPECTLSLDIGAQYLADLFHRTDPLSPSEWCRMADHIRNALAAAPLARRRFPPQGIGAGGTFTTLANVHRQRSELKRPLHGYCLRTDDLEMMALRLAFVPQPELRQTAGISPDRARIVPAGACLAFQLVRHLGLKAVTVCDRGLREGLLLELVERETGHPPVPLTCGPWSPAWLPGPRGSC